QREWHDNGTVRYADVAPKLPSAPAGFISHVLVRNGSAFGRQAAYKTRHPMKSTVRSKRRVWFAAARCPQCGSVCTKVDLGKKFNWQIFLLIGVVLPFGLAGRARLDRGLQGLRPPLFDVRARGR